MTYGEAREYLRGIEKSRGIRLGLERMEQLLEELGHPEQGLHIIHAAGTNGKGSVLKYLETILLLCGYHVVRYSSPAVFRPLEILTKDGKDISEESFADLTGRGKAASDRLLSLGKEQPTLYELQTAMAFLYARQEGCDFMLLETCMGGRTDATNAAKSVSCSVITSVSMDHEAFLGNTIEQIAWEKAGIIKEGCPVVVSCHNRQLESIFQKAAAEKHAELIWGEELPWEPGLMGVHQRGNAGAAAAVICVLRQQGYDIPQSKLFQGIRHTVWAGRFQQICDDPVCILDGAHNPDGARNLKETLLELTGAGKLPVKKYFVFGVFKDKKYEAIAEETVPLAEEVYTVKPPGDRGLEAGLLADCVKKYNSSVYAVESPRRGVAAAFQKAREEKGMVLCYGSLSFLGEADQTIRELHASRRE